MNHKRFAVFLLLVAALCGRAAADNGADAAARCDRPGPQLQVLRGATAGPSAPAPSGQLLWIEGKARVLLESGPGAAQHLQASGARAADLDLILFSRLQAERTLDLPLLVEAALREGRERPLPLYGPVGNRLNPSTVTFVRALLDGTRGAYRYLGGVLRPLTEDGFKLQPHDVRARPARVAAPRKAAGLLNVYVNPRFAVEAAYVDAGNMPALAWRITARERTFVFVGAPGGGATLERLATKADMLVAEYTAAKSARGAERRRLSAAAIGELAAKADVGRLVLLARAPQPGGEAAALLAAIRARYAGPVLLAEDVGCFSVP